MREEIAEDMTKIPEYFPKFDVRKPASQVVDDKLTEILNEVFEIRKNLEKTFTRNELLSYDKILAKHLSAEILIPKLELEISKDFNMMQQIQQ